MSIAEKLVTIAENEQKVYEAGQQSEYDRFWDTLQENGNRTKYFYAFSRSCLNWTDDLINSAKYPIVCANDPASAQNTFYNKNFTELTIPIIIRGIPATSTFEYAYNLKTIADLTFEGVSTFKNTFAYCNNLKNINIKGSIDGDINFSSCPLSKGSLLNIISVLKDFRTTQSYDCSFKTWQEIYMADFMDAFPSFAYDKFFECDYYEEVAENTVFISIGGESLGIQFDEELPTEVAEATHIAFDESGKSITLKFPATSVKTLTIGETNLAKLTSNEKDVALDKGWDLA